MAVQCNKSWSSWDENSILYQPFVIRSVHFIVLTAIGQARKMRRRNHAMENKTLLFAIVLFYYLWFQKWVVECVWCSIDVIVVSNICVDRNDIETGWFVVSIGGNMIDDEWLWRKTYYCDHSSFHPCKRIRTNPHSLSACKKMEALTFSTCRVCQ